MINLHERMLPTSVGVEPATFWSPIGWHIQLSHRSWPDQCQYSSDITHVAVCLFWYEILSDYCATSLINTNNDLHRWNYKSTYMYILWNLLHKTSAPTINKGFFLINLNYNIHHYKLLTLNAPRKPASENVICLCRLLNILANFSNLFLQTGKQCGPRSDCS